MKTLITGVAGFLGSALAQRLLDEGHEVLGPDDLSTGKEEAIPEGVEREMVGASQDVSTSTVSMTVALRKLIAGNRDRIDNLLQTIGQAFPPDQADPLAPVMPINAARAARPITSQPRRLIRAPPARD